ncbi:MAG: hypothetical protein K6F84_08425 [Lachnospiraceae bacterium]|nr:hypothetical protein [Lachnospiraceae bacterium]
MNDLEYFDDDALEKLIADVEQNDLVKAPDRITKNVLAAINLRERKIVEYRRYRLQVGLAIAAAAVFLLVTPVRIAFGSKTMVKPEAPSKESVLEAEKVPSKESILEANKVPSKEEVMAKYDRTFSDNLKRKVEDIIVYIGGSE